MSYYLRFRGKIFGPFDAVQLKEMKAKRTINKISDISENKIDWFPASSLAFLFPPSLVERQDSSKPPEPEKAEWFYSINGIDGYGPETQSKIIQMIQTGALPAHSYVWQQDQDAKPIRTIKPFNEYFKIVSPLSNQQSNTGVNNISWFHSPANIVKLSLVVIAIVVFAIVVKAVGSVVIKSENLVFLQELLSNSNIPIKLNDAGIKPKEPAILSTQEAIAKTEASVAVIKGLKGHGTGFLIRTGVLVTNKHVIDDQILELSTVYFPAADKENRKKFQPKLLYKDPNLDLAFLQIDTKLAALPIAENYQFKRGEEVVAIGNPGVGNDVMEIAVNKGILSSEATIDNRTFYQLGISINAGNSGGPAINQTGQVIGMVTLKARTEKGIEGIAFCIPCDDILKSLAEMEKLNENEKKINNSKHRAKVALKWMAEVDYLFRICMNQYIKAMSDAIKKNENPYDAINDTKREVEKIMDKIEYFFLDDTEKELVKVITDTNIQESVRKNIKDYYAACMEEKKFVENPRIKSKNTVEQIREQKKELEEKCDALLTPLLMELGILKSEIGN
ncbi:MAG: trypsin-like peptidase domain-containing protein [Planctomycetaceae bacterium]|jgi:S1-C subfamily serine protease|nr:trypsin-like peptidase domain-containing protein [Planctomycetaceae bacterium]